MNTMNQPKPIETSSNADLRGSWHALLRAAARARQIAAQTGTALVVVRNGVREHVYPQPEAPTTSAQAPAAGKGKSS
jgi:hypothetical protein